MKVSAMITSHFFLILISSCRNSNNVHHSTRHLKIDLLAANDSAQTFNGDINAITSDFTTWYRYTHYNIHLALDFIGLDINADTLDKRTFLDQLATGKFIPIKISSGNNLLTYKLFKTASSDNDIKNTMTRMAENEIRNYDQEGTEFPYNNFTDLSGITYNESDTKGKILVVKCWFVGCIPCVKEFPQCNELVNRYASRKDILFISLAMNSRETLLSYLKVNPFRYAVIPDKEEYLVKDLKITEYPTHLLINRQGTITKVTNSIEDLIPFLEKEARK